MKWPSERQCMPKVQKTERFYLPSPRLQFTWLKNNEDGSEWVCVYTLVLQLKQYDIRREGRNGKQVRRELFIRLGMTGSQGAARSDKVYEGVVETPFRDGAHASWDREQLGNLPVYAVCGDTWSKIDKQQETKAA